eukprot:3473167-Ditylum_brightwellii.AAC.1
MAMLFLQNADKARYGKKYDEIDKASELGRGEFPITLTVAFDVAVVVEIVQDVVVEVVKFQMETLRLMQMAGHKYVLQMKNQ